MLKLSIEKELTESSSPEPELEPPQEPPQLSPPELELEEELEDEPHPIWMLEEESWPHEPPMALPEVRGAKRPLRARLPKLPASVHCVLPK